MQNNNVIKNVTGDFEKVYSKLIYDILQILHIVREKHFHLNAKISSF